ncbi:SDR family NAD(P)-dependent oxidoreductase [Loktanella agnita]|uniref:SDR family NAD(P)-dependent oxidoreductase n=1 Tax=Loktanella agnita TaxID=287097 RepID=UPI003985C6AB
MEHTGKHAVVTGGGTGIGQGIAVALAEAGAEVTITGRRADKLEEVAAQNPRLHPLVMDVTDESSVRDGMAQAAAARGPVQICVANAGIAEGGPFADTSLAAWQRTMGTNLDGVFLTLQSALATLGPDDDARMIIISSVAGLRGLKGAIPYTVSKHAVIGLIHGLSEEYMKRPITFNAICPGYVDTPIVRNQLPSVMKRFSVDEAGAIEVMARGNRHRKLLEVDETTSAAMWLCSDGARSVNGQTVNIAGGQV